MTAATAPTRITDPVAVPPTGRPVARTWLITGAGRGLGRAFATEALACGDRVVGTVRRAGALDDLVGAHPGAVVELLLDVRDRDASRAAVDRAAAAFGGLDVVVNNAGYGIVGAVEEWSRDDVVDHLDTNLLGAIWVTQAALPHLRAAGGGDVVQVSTTGGVGSMPTFGLYNAGKWGLEGFSEALAPEVAPFGVRVTIAELGGFATDWAGPSMRFATPSPEYDPLRRSLFGTAEVPWPQAGEGAAADVAPPGDASAAAEAPAEGGPSSDDASADAPPSVAARALLAHLDRPAAERPLRLLVGDDAPEHVALALQARRDDYVRDERFRWPAA